MLTCKEYAEMKKKELKEYIAERELHPTLVVIQVGDRPESNSYIRGKMRDCEEVGIECEVLKRMNTTQEQLETQIEILNYRKDVHGIIVQLPVPEYLDVHRIQELITPGKDVDGFSPYSDFDPCTPAGVIGYLKAIDYKFEGTDALVIGRSDIVGKPLARMLTDLDCTVTLAHSKTRHIISRFENADIVFTATDKIESIKLNGFPFNHCGPTDFIDIGLGRGKDGKLHGNLSEDSVNLIKVHYPNRICISGTGGVGLLTRVALLENVVKAADIQSPKPSFYAC